MKKHQTKTAQVVMLGYSAAMAVAGSMISLDAVAGCTAGTATGAVHCEFTPGASAPWADAWSFTGSNNVSMAVNEDATGFAACAYHKDGKKSYGLTIAGGSMTVRDATGKTADATAGCAS